MAARTFSILGIVAGSWGLSGCDVAAPHHQYSPPEASGLVGVRPYPGGDDICQVIGENPITNHYLDHTTLLIGCPSHDVGAIEDRVAEGAQILDVVGAWQLLSVPVH